MDRAQQFASSHVGGTRRRGAAVAALIWAAALMGEAAAQPGDLFTPASPGPADTAAFLDRARPDGRAAPHGHHRLRVARPAGFRLGTTR